MKTEKSNLKVTAFAILAATLVLAAGFYFYRAWSTPTYGENDFRYFYAGCSVYSRNGKIVYTTRGYICDFADDGKVLSSDPSANILMMRDQHNNLLWNAVENAHHDLKFTNDQRHFLLTTSEVLEFENQLVRSDCFSKRTLENKIVSEWCLRDHLAQLRSLGFHFSAGEIRHTNRMKKFPDLASEISHANSIYEIEDNAMAEKIPAFKKGNYLIHLFKSSYALLIIDPEMKTILWSKDLSKMKYGLDYLQFETHDNQVTPDGQILMYVNVTYLRSHFSVLTNPDDLPLLDKGFDWHSSLVKYNPLTENLTWLFESLPPENFKSIALGSVTELRNGNYLFSDITGHSAVFEVDKNRKTVWKFLSPLSERYVNKIVKAKPLYNDAFLKAHGIRE